MGNTVDVHINGSEDVSAAVAKAIQELEKLRDRNYTIKVDVDKKNAEEAIKGLHEDMDKLKDRKIDLDVDTSKARKKLTYLHERVEQLGEKGQDVDINTDKARKKLTYLHDRLGQLADGKTEVDLDTTKARDKLTYLNNRLKTINDSSAKIDVNTGEALAELEALQAIIENMEDKRINLEIRIDGLFEAVMAKEVLDSITDKRVELKIDTDGVASAAAISAMLDALTEDRTININPLSMRRMARDIADATNGSDETVDIDARLNVVQALSALTALRAALDAIDNSDINVDVHYTDEDIRRLFNEDQRMEIDFDFDSAYDDLAKLKAQLESVDGSEVDMDLDLSGALADLARLKAMLDAIKDQEIGVDIDADTAEARLAAIRQAIDDVTINVDADTASAEAQIARAARNRRSTINVDVDRSALNRLNGVFNGVNRGLAGMTRSIPVIGGLFRGLSSLGEALGNVGSTAMRSGNQFIRLGGGLASVAGVAGTAAIALAGLGTVGAILGGAVTGGVYVAQAALGTLVGVAGAVTAAIGGAIAAGFGAIAYQNEEVKKTFDDSFSYIADRMKSIATVVEPAMKSLGTGLAGAFDILAPSLERVAAGSAQLIQNLSNQLPAIAQAAGPALEQIFDAGRQHMDLFISKIPALTTGLGNMFAKMSDPAVMQAMNTVWDKIPGIMEGIGSAVVGASNGFNKLNDFLSSDSLQPLRDGWAKLKSEFDGLDTSGIADSLGNVMNSFGDFMGSIDGEDITGTIENIGNSIASLNNIATTIDLTGMIESVTSGFAAAADAADKGSSAFLDALDFQSPEMDWTSFNPQDWFDWGMIADGAAEAGSTVANAFGDAFGATMGGLAGLLDGLGLDELADEARRQADWGYTGTDGKPMEMAIPINVVPDLLNEDGFEGIKALTDQIGDLEPIEKVQPINAIIELAEDGQLTGSQLEGIINRSGGIGDLPPQEKLQIINVLYELVADGKLSPEDLTKILGPAGLPPIDADQVVNIRTELGNILGLDQASYKLTQQLSDLAQPGGAPVEITQDALLRINADPKVAEDQVRALLGTLTGLAPQDVDLLITAAPKVIIPNLGPQIAAATGLQGPVNIQQQLDVQTQLGNIVGVDPGQISSRLQSLAQSNGGTAPVRVTADVLAEMGRVMGLEPGQVEAAVEALLGSISGVPVDVVVDVNTTLGSVLGVEPGMVSNKIKELAGANGGTAQIDVTADIIAKLGSVMNLDAAGVEAMLEKMFSTEDYKVDITVTGEAKPTLGDGGPTGLMGGFGEEIKNKFGQSLGKGVDVDVPVNVRPQVTVGNMGVESVTAALRDKQVFKTDLGMQAQQIKVQVIPDLSTMQAALGTLGAMSLPPVRVQIIPDISTLAAAMGTLGAMTLPPIRVQIIPDTAGFGTLGLLAIPPIRVQVLVDPPVVPPIAVPPVQIPSVVLPPAIPMIYIPPVTVNIIVVPPQMPQFPNTTSTHTVQVIAPPIPPYPNTTSTHTVIMNAPASTPSYPNTSSTHTVNIVVNGSLPGGGGSSIRQAAMGAMNSMASAARGIGAMGASIPMGAGPSMSGGGRGVATIRRTGEAISASIGQGLMDGKVAIDNAVGQIGASIAKVGSEIDSELSQISPEYNEAKRLGGEIVNNITSGIDSARGQLDGALAGVNKAFNDALAGADQFLSANVPGYDMAKKQFQGLQTAASVAATEFQKIISEEFQLPSLDQIIGGAGLLADGAVKAILGDPTQLNATLDKMNSDLGTKIATIQGKVGEAMAKVHQSLIDNVPGYKEAAEQVQGFVKGFQDTISGLNEAATVGAAGFQKIFDEEFQLPSMDQVLAKAQEIGDGIGQALAGDPSKLAGTMDQLGTALTSKLGTVAGKVDAVMGQINQTMRDKVPGFADAQDKAIGFANGITQAVDKARQDLNAQLSAAGLPTIPTPQMALDGINAEVAKARAALDAGIRGIQPPQIPTPQMAIAGVQAEVQKVKTNIENGLRGMLVQTPKPTVPAPNLNPVMQALSRIPGAIDTVNRVQSDADRAIADINKIPAVVDTKAVVDTNVQEALRAIRKLQGQNTSSTHTIKVNVSGGSSARGAVARRAGGAMGIARGAGVSPVARGAGGISGGISPSAGGGLLYNAGVSISLSVAAGIEAGIPAIINAGNAMTEAAFNSLGSGLGSVAYENGKASALGYINGIMSQYGTATQVGGKLGENIFAGSVSNGNWTDFGKQIKQMNQLVQLIGGPIGQFLTGLIPIPLLGPLLMLGGILLAQGAQRAAYNNAPVTKTGITNYYYYHYETTNNSFDGGLVGDPESQARRVLDVLEQSPSTRRIRKVFSQ